MGVFLDRGEGLQGGVGGEGDPPQVDQGTTTKGHRETRTVQGHEFQDPVGGTVQTVGGPQGVLHGWDQGIEQLLGVGSRGVIGSGSSSSTISARVRRGDKRIGARPTLTRTFSSNRRSVTRGPRDRGGSSMGSRASKLGASRARSGRPTDSRANTSVASDMGDGRDRIRCIRSPCIGRRFLRCKFSGSLSFVTISRAFSCLGGDNFSSGSLARTHRETVRSSMFRLTCSPRGRGYECYSFYNTRLAKIRCRVVTSKHRHYGRYSGAMLGAISRFGRTFLRIEGGVRTVFKVGVLTSISIGAVSTEGLTEGLHVGFAPAPKFSNEILKITVGRGNICHLCIRGRSPCLGTITAVTRRLARV